MQDIYIDINANISAEDDIQMTTPLSKGRLFLREKEADVYVQRKHFALCNEHGKPVSSGLRFDTFDKFLNWAKDRQKDDVRLGTSDYLLYVNEKSVNFFSKILMDSYRNGNEGELKVGSWVRDGENIYQFAEPSSDWSYQQSLKTCSLWSPKVDEWCWSKYNGLVQVVSKNSEGDYKIMTNPFSTKDQFENTFVSALEPFIGTLPSCLNKTSLGLKEAVSEVQKLTGKIQTKSLK